MQDTTHLLEMIKVLNHQLDEKDRQIANFQERDREHNVLIKNLYDRVLLLESGSQTVDADQPQAPAPEPQPEPLPRWHFWQRRRRKF